MPTPLQPPTIVEKVAGSVVTESALTVLAVALGGALLAPLLPVLAKSLASERQMRRIEAALSEITSWLESNDKALLNLTDAQYKFINEVVLAVLHTTSDEKLSYLRRAIRNGLAMTDIQPQESVFLSRVLRDISAEETDFLVREFSHKRIQLGAAPSGGELPGTLVVPEGSRNELMVSGLISLGLLIPAGPTVNDLNLLRFSNGVAKLIMLLR